MTKLLLLILVVSIISLIVLQTNRLIYMRSLGLFLIMGCAVVYYMGQRENDYLKLTALAALMTLGFLSDYFAATLRTWYFRVSPQALWGLVIGSFVGLMVWPLFNTISGFLLGAIVGAMIGEIWTRGFRYPRQILKATVGACAGLFGMSIKLLLGLEMIYLLIHDFHPINL